MRTQLIKAGLWDQGESGNPESDISSTWRVLARVGRPGRYVGKTQNGLYEYVIINPETDALLPSGKGSTLTMAMCEAALAASKFSEGQQHCL